MVAVVVAAGNERHGVLVQGVAARVQGACHNVYALHTHAGSEADGPLNRNRVGRSDLLAGKAR